MQLLEITSSLKRRLEEYKSTERYRLNSDIKIAMEGISKAVEIAERAYESGSKISDHEKYWFEGVTAVARYFDETGWHDIATRYAELSEEVQLRFY